MKSLDNKTKYFAYDSVVSFALSFSRSLIGLGLLIGVIYGGAFLLDSAFDFLFKVP